MVKKRPTITVETEYLVLNSKTPCPECGGREWLPYVYEWVSQEFTPLGARFSNVDVEAIIDKPYDNFCFDECLGCGIAVSCANEVEEETFLEDVLLPTEDDCQES